jgi:sacsin
MKNMPCVFDDKGGLILPGKCFLYGKSGLSPYRFTVDRGFRDRHMVLLKELGVRDGPEFNDFIEIQAELEAACPLDSINIAVAVNLAMEMSSSATAQIKLPDENGELVHCKDLTYRDVIHETVKGNYVAVHPEVPRQLTSQLGIEPLSARVKKGELGIEDIDDEDEYYQTEDVCDGIADTLHRYPIETTFTEYLANAEDCGSASELNWLLDERYHQTDKLVSDELGPFQGPSLLIHNNGSE